MPPSDKTDTEPSALFLLLTELPRPHRVVDLPRKRVDGSPVSQVRMVPLTQSEMATAAAESERRTRAHLKDGIPKRDDAQTGYTDVYNNIAACEVLFRACKAMDDEDGGGNPRLVSPAFKTPHEVGKAFSNDEIGVLYNIYLTVTRELGPLISTMTEAEVDLYVALLAEGGSSAPLDSLSWGALSTLVTTMASRLHALRTDKSSPGSPADPTPEDDEDTPASSTR